MAFRGLLVLLSTPACVLLVACGGTNTKTVTRTETRTATVSAPTQTAPPGVPSTAPSSARAQDAKAKDDARKAVAQLDLCGRDAGSFQGCKGTGIPRNVELAELTAKGYMVTAESESGETFTVTRSPSGSTRTCSPRGAGDCPASGTW